MRSEISLSAPAKINLSLRVLRRREDGFHEIATRMVPLGLADGVEMRRLEGGAPGTVEFWCDDETVPGDEGNLAVRAVRALEGRCGKLPAVGIRLEKRVPHGAGLGGGSSDAAAVLRGLNELFGLGLSVAELSGAAAMIGSDIPFFLHGCVCDATGRGEVVAPVEGWGGSLRVLLVKLPFGVPTPGAYREWRDSREVPGLPYGEQVLVGGEVLVNDLERPVFAKYPVLGMLKRRLLEMEGVSGALMSGSGSTVFAVLEEGAVVEPVLAAVREECGEELWWCETRAGAGEVRS
jgi:4-diphosphocytidyl-2-C-methyl-D-erythritol kinase